MKTKITISLLILLFSISFLAFNSSKKESNSVSTQTQFARPDSFYIGAIDNGWAFADYDKLKELKLNIWHKYPDFDYGWYPLVSRDLLFDDSVYFYSNIKDKISNIKSNNFDVIMDRAKMTYLTYGRSSDYKAADVSQQDSLYWFYRYYNHNSAVSSDSTDNSAYGNGIKVRKSTVGINNTGYVFSGLISNREQIKNGENNMLQPQNRFWHIIPRIRINPDYANNSNLDTTRICRIEVLKFDGTIIDSVTIKANNFLNKSLPGQIYNGSYIEYYYQNDTLNRPNKFVRDTSFIIESSQVLNPDDSTYANVSNQCHVDYRIYWYGECDMWVDRIRVCNQIAFDLFDENVNNLTHNTYMKWIRWETGLGMTDNAGWRFACDEPEFCKMPVLKYLNDKIITQSAGKLGMLPLLSYDLLRIHLPGYLYNDHFTPTRLKKYLVDNCAFREYYFDSYTFGHFVDLPYKINGNNYRYNKEYGILANSAENIESYESTTNYLFGWPYNDGGNQFLGQALRRGLDLSKLSGIPFYPVLQAHLYWQSSCASREPTNEEIRAMANLALGYGAKGIFYFAYQGFGEYKSDYFCRGLVNPNSTYTLPYDNSPQKRLFNEYGQAKWDSICSLNNKIKKLSKHFLEFDPKYTNSYVYNTNLVVNDKDSLINGTFVKGLKTYKPGIGISDTDTNVQNLTTDAQNITYAQISFFKKSEIEENIKYFMVLNKRCSPGWGNQSDTEIGGRRIITIDLSGLTPFNNWKIYNLEDNSLYKTFDKNVHEINLGNFLPGEGKLFKLIPVMQAGGDLVCNEIFSELTFTNDSIVNGNGYNMTIGGSNNISFNSKGGIVMNGGVFRCGTKFSNGNVILQGVNTWDGIVLNNCTSVNMQKTEIKNISYLPGQDFLYGININGGSDNIITGCRFTNNNNAGFVNINVSNNSSSTSFITGNTLNGEGSSVSVNVISSGGTQNQVYIQGNYIYSDNSPGSAINLSNVTGGVVTNNVINNYFTGINLIFSTVDLYGNYIFCNSVNSNAINITSSSTANLSSSQSVSGTVYVGGINVISYTGLGANNIKSDNSNFYLDYGNNNFTIGDTNSYHLTGWIPGARYCYNNRIVYARDNCFYLNGNISSLSNVTCGYNGTLVNFDYSSQSSSCIAVDLEQNEVISLAEDINDTLWIKSTGSSGSMKGHREGQAMALQVSNGYKALKDSININFRRRNFSVVEEKCKEMLNLYPDSTFTIDALAKLYYSSLKLDINGNKIGPLKSYYETLILNNSENYTLIMKANYLVQKSKVILKQYTSALQGFQEIINQNPYSYEGLVASWDFAATNLLANNSGGRNTDEQNENQEVIYNDNLIPTIDYLYSMLDTLRNRKVNVNTYTNDNYDKSVFTSKDREALKTNVENMYKNERTKQIIKLEELEKQSKSKNEIISRKSMCELKTMKTLGEVVKIKKPNTMAEHIKNINKDISKVLGVDKSDRDYKTKNTVPTTYSLSQNYPNPFNPVTKINYDLPKDGKVKLVIFDILGREIKSLVNNEFKTAGRYTVEFNGTQFASGIYFYRIQVEDGKGYTAVKKMVLVK